MLRRLRHIVTAITDKAEVDPAVGRLDLEDIEGDSGRIITEPAVRQERTGEGVMYESGDVLFGKLRPYLRKAVLPEEGGSCSPELVVMRPDPELADPRFVHYLTLSEPFISWAIATSVGVKMPRTSWESLADFRVELPSLDLQREVAADLATQIARLDTLVNAKQRFKRAVTHRQNVYAESVVYDPSRQYRMTRLMHLVDQDRPVMYGIVLPGPDVGDGVLVVKGGDVEANRLTPEQLAHTTPEIEEPYARARLKEGDLLVSIRGSFGAVAQVPAELEGANITQDVARVAPAPGVNARWLYHVLSSNFIYGQLDAVAVGATIRGVNIRDLDRIPIPVPSSQEADRIAAQLDAAAMKPAALLAQVDRQIELLKVRRRALITEAVAAVTGLEEMVPA